MVHGRRFPDRLRSGIAPEVSAPEWTFADILLTCRLKTALKLLNPDVPAHGVEEVFRKFTRLDAPKELADALYEWIRKGGFPPVTIGDESLGKNWHKTIATFACLAVANRVEDIRKRRGRRQTKGGD